MEVDKVADTTKCIEPKTKCIGPKLFDAKCTRLACLLKLCESIKSFENQDQKLVLLNILMMNFVCE